jgi:IS1 family transposase
VWTWVAIAADTRLAIPWFVGDREADAGWAFLQDVAAWLAQRIQLTSDGHRAYLEATAAGFATEVDYAMLVKLSGEPPPEGRPYTVISGTPVPQPVSTSYVERQNLSLRMSSRRFTRKTNAFSKKIENLAGALAFHYLHSNFVRIHPTLRVNPAMEAGVA